MLVQKLTEYVYGKLRTAPSWERVHLPNGKMKIQVKIQQLDAISSREEL